MKHLAFVLLLLASTSAKAGWTLVDDIQSGYIYFDFAIIQKRTNLITMWALFDLKAAKRVANGAESLSMKAHQEYDCGGRRYRSVYTAFYSGAMGTGELIDSNPVPGDWITVPAESAAQGFWKAVCKR